MKFLLFLLIGFSLFSMSCTPEPSPPEPPDGTPDNAEMKDGDMIGLTLEAAEAMAKERGLKSRVVSVDGDVRPVTMDYLTDRVNFTIEGGKVVKVSRG